MESLSELIQWHVQRLEVDDPLDVVREFRDETIRLVGEERYWRAVVLGEGGADSPDARKLLQLVTEWGDLQKRLDEGGNALDPFDMLLQMLARIRPASADRFFWEYLDRVLPAGTNPTVAIGSWCSWVLAELPADGELPQVERLDHWLARRLGHDARTLALCREAITHGLLARKDWERAADRLRRYGHAFPDQTATVSAWIQIAKHLPATDVLERAIVSVEGLRREVEQKLADWPAYREELTAFLFEHSTSLRSRVRAAGGDGPRLEATLRALANQGAASPHDIESALGELALEEDAMDRLVEENLYRRAMDHQAAVRRYELRAGDAEALRGAATRLRAQLLDLLLPEEPRTEGEPPKFPTDARLLVILEGESDAEYLRLAATRTGVPLEGIHLVPATGAADAARALVQYDGVVGAGRRAIAILDDDESGRAAGDALNHLKLQKNKDFFFVSRWGVRDERIRDFEAEDLFPRSLIEAVVAESPDEYGEGTRSRQDGSKRHELKLRGKERLLARLRAEEPAETFAGWRPVLETLIGLANRPTGAPPKTPLR